MLIFAFGLLDRQEFNEDTDEELVDYSQRIGELFSRGHWPCLIFEDLQNAK